MKIKVLKKIDYKGLPVYIRRIDKLFEYLIIYKGNLFSHYLDIKPSWNRRFFKEKYTEKQLEDIIKVSIKSAEITIDKLLK